MTQAFRDTIDICSSIRHQGILVMLWDIADIRISIEVTRRARNVWLAQEEKYPMTSNGGWSTSILILASFKGETMDCFGT